MIDKGIRNVINRFIELYKENQNRWKNERQAHYDFFKLLFSTFEPDEIRNYFKWEYPIDVPSYGRGNKGAAIDIVFENNVGKWIAIEIELVGAGEEFKNELIKCVQKLQTPQCNEYMTKGYIIPLLARKAGKKARGYGGESYSTLCDKAVKNAEDMIGNFPIEIIKDGILLS